MICDSSDNALCLPVEGIPPRGRGGFERICQTTGISSRYAKNWFTALVSKQTEINHVWTNVFNVHSVKHYKADGAPV